MIAALFVDPHGPYANDLRIDVWDKARDARKYRGPHKVIAHPPCERWGRYWGGGPMLHGTSKQKLLGDDQGCFASALWAVRTFGGVLEHPEASHAFHYYGVAIPKQRGDWTSADRYGGRSCCVAQGHYGHQSQKLTWLYGVDINYPQLRWGKAPGKVRMEDGFHSTKERSAETKRFKRILTRDRMLTPGIFKELLIALAVPAPFPAQIFSPMESRKV